MENEYLKRFDELGFEALDEEQKRLVMDEESGIVGEMLRGFAMRPVFNKESAVGYQLVLADYGRAAKSSPELSLEQRWEALKQAETFLTEMFMLYVSLPFQHSNYWKVYGAKFVEFQKWIVKIKDKLEKLGS